MTDDTDFNRRTDEVLVTPKDSFIAELNPILLRAEQLLRAGESGWEISLLHKVVVLVVKYEDLISRDELRDALSNPVANAIAERLGVKRLQ